MHPDAAGAAVTGTRHTHRRTFKRRQRQEQFRAAVAFALALGTVTERILMFMWREEITWGGVVYMSGKT